MFEQVLSSRVPPSPLRRTALPAALALQSALGALLVAHALFGPERLTPPVTLTFWQTPATLEPPPAARTAAPASASSTCTPARPRGIEAPNEIPAGPPDATEPQDTEPVSTWTKRAPFGRRRWSNPPTPSSTPPRWRGFGGGNTRVPSTPGAAPWWPATSRWL